MELEGKKWRVTGASHLCRRVSGDTFVCDSELEKDVEDEP